MDQNLSVIIVAVISGLFSVITLIIQKRSDKVINKIDDRTTFIAKEKEIKQKLTEKENERESIIHEVMILILDTNLNILMNTQIDSNGKKAIDDDVFKMAEDLKENFAKVTGEIRDITKEYQTVLDMTEAFRKEIEKNRAKKQ